MKVTNNALEKKLCIAVKTNGESGTIRKKNIDRIEPGTVWAIINVQHKHTASNEYDVIVIVVHGS